jgi:hypothetical protein
MLEPHHIALCRKNAALAQIGGVSRIRSREEREATLPEDQLVGQIGECAGCIWLTGTDTSYRLSRALANDKRTQGDRGKDIPASNIDFKGSLHRNQDLPLTAHRLSVRPHEWHENWVYFLVMVDLLPDGGALASIMGWAHTNMLPPEPNGTGEFKGAYVLFCRDLHPVPPFRWQYYPGMVTHAY